jgi:hypothetical protein
MAGKHLDVPLGDANDSDGPGADEMREIPWSGLALSGMGLIAISLVAFVMVTDERTPPQHGLITLEPIFTKRMSAPDIAQNPLAPRTDISRTDDATSTISRTIRTAPTQTIVSSSGKTDVATRLAPAPDPRLIAQGPHGALPRIGRDGARPAAIYARPMTAGIVAGAPRIAIVLTGLGLDAAISARAVEALAPAITLAFAPYADDVEDQAAQARAAGHELLLQTPMEGFAENHAAPRTLAANAPRERTLNALHWHMSRFPGYIGLTNLSGARFMSAPQAFAPVMQDVADRGLVFLDDGASPQTLTIALAAATGADAARADIVLDASQKTDAIDAALRKLEALARERGSAIGVASAGAHSIDRIGRFTQGLAVRGVALVPVSALIAAPARTSAR